MLVTSDSGSKSDQRCARQIDTYKFRTLSEREFQFVYNVLVHWGGWGGAVRSSRLLLLFLLKFMTVFVACRDSARS